MEKKKNYIICDAANANWGKTETLNALIKKLGNPSEIKKFGKDTWALYKIKERIVVVSTQGDPKSHQKECLLEAVDEKANIIVCASRIKGTTKDNVRTIASKNGYELIWFQNFHLKSNYSQQITDVSVEALYDLINKLL